MADRDASGAEATARIEDATALFDENPAFSLASCDEDGPWVVRAFFVEDEPEPGRLDVCCALTMSPRKLDAFTAGAPVAFIVGGDDATRWLQGTGRAQLVDDEADAAAVRKRLADRSPAVEPFLSRVDAHAVRIHVEVLRLTDLGADPPITEFRFA